LTFLKTLLSKAKGESISLGIDIGHFSVKTAAISHSPKGFEVIGVIENQLPAGSIVEGVIQKPEALESEILDSIESLGLYKSDCDIYTALSWCNGVLADQIKLNIQNPAKEEEVILFEAGSKPPFDEVDITLDYKILNRKESSNEIEVLLVAAKNVTLNKWADLFHSIGIKPNAFDIDSFAGLNAFGYDHEPEGSRVEAIVNFGHSRSHITFVKDGSYHSTRELKGVSVFAFVKIITRKLNIQPEDAALAMQGDISRVSQERYVKAYDYAVNELAKAITQAISFFQSLASGRSVDKINLIGGGSYCRQLDEVLSGKLSLDVEIKNPLKSLPIAAKSRVSQNQQEEGSKYSVALGLAMRKG
jgi:type IV pilus assembly protein PilM